MNTEIEEFLNTVYNNLFDMPLDKRNKILFDIFGWGGADAYKFIRENRSAVRGG